MYCSNCGKALGADANFCQFCGARLAPLPPPYIPNPPGPRPFARHSGEKMIGGVCAGVARYFDLSIPLVRCAWALSFFLAGTGLLAYIILWIVMPLDPEYLPLNP